MPRMVHPDESKRPVETALPAEIVQLQARGYVAQAARTKAVKEAEAVPAPVTSRRAEAPAATAERMG